MLGKHCIKTETVCSHRQFFKRSEFALDAEEELTADSLSQAFVCNRADAEELGFFFVWEGSRMKMCLRNGAGIPKCFRSVW